MPAKSLNLVIVAGLTSAKLGAKRMQTDLNSLCFH